MLRRKPGIDLTYFVVDVLAVDGHATTMNTYAERRSLLEELDLECGPVRLVATLEDGEALFDAVCARGLEGVVAKRLSDPYKPAERQWVKTKNRNTARFAEERDGVGRRISTRS